MIDFVDTKPRGPLMEKAEMEEAVSETRQVIAAFEQGTLQEEGTGTLVPLRRILRDREAWLRGEWPDVEQLMKIAEGARMFIQAEAIEFLRSWGHIGHLNHDPLHKVEQEWLNRIFIGRERISRGWLCLAAIVADSDQTGIHVQDHLQVPCRCDDAWSQG